MSYRATLLSGGLVDVERGADPLYRAWEAVPNRHTLSPITFPCGAGAAGRHAFGGTLVAIGYSSVLEYAEESGQWRALHCPPLSLREGYPNSQCRKLGASVTHPNASWPARREITYLGLGRVLAWERATMRYDVYSFAARGLADPLRNTSAAPFFEHVGRGRLAGVDNSSALLHLHLPTAAAAERRHVVLEILADNSYRVWNSEGWATLALRGAGDLRRSPLAGPVGRGRLPAESGAYDPHVEWTPSPDGPYIVELDRREGTYRTLRVRVGDMDSLEPATSRAPPLYFEASADGLLDGDAVPCASARTRAECAAAGGACGWCEQVDGVRPSVCAAGGPARPCAATPSCARGILTTPSRRRTPARRRRRRRRRRPASARTPCYASRATARRCRRCRTRTPPPTSTGRGG